MSEKQTEYMTNAQGHLVPKSMVKDLDLLRDETVKKIVCSALELQKLMVEFKELAFADVSAFMGISADQYDTKIGGEKGNLSLSSYDGQYKVLVAADTSIILDEKLHIAKQLIDNCIHRWTANSNDNLKALVEHAFRTDKSGNINTARVLGLLQLKIDDAEWGQAMAALKDSIQPNKSKRYLRLYRRVNDTNKYEQISLDIAGL
ncbi:MAG: DUF3164 family protein [Methylovulum sp.]|nr:DUF3164 family protein [Methylovulum sp.]